MASVADFSSSLFQWVRLYVCRLVWGTYIHKQRVNGAVLSGEMGLRVNGAVIW